ncbi:MAG: hypothetical protein CMG74_12590 [Candidatus Marinimicrobia bacterium]|nr:hypothetical protein [Candidatus Neomarinimicrobiota bacterium]
MIWLNSNLGFEGYQYITQRIQAILPRVDEFLPVHNINSLMDLGMVLAKLDKPSRRKLDQIMGVS